MDRYYRNFYTTSEDDMRELVVVRDYISKRNLNNKDFEVKYSPIIVIEVEPDSKDDVDYLRLYGFNVCGGE